MYIKMTNKNVKIDLINFIQVIRKSHVTLVILFWFAKLIKITLNFNIKNSKE